MEYLIMAWLLLAKERYVFAQYYSFSCMYSAKFESYSALISHKLHFLYILFSVQGNCIGATAYRDRLERDLTTLGCNFIVRKAFVPSFCELYLFTASV